MYGAAGRLADRLAVEVLTSRGRSAEPCADIMRLAAELNILEVLRLPLLEEGRLEPVPGGYRVLISDDLPDARARFTLAHELGHRILLEPESGWSAMDETRARFKSEEALCDAIAGGLLMPRPWVWSEYRDAPQTLKTVQHLAYRARVSLSAAIVRLREVTGWRHSLLHWSFEGGRWLLDGEAGLFTEQMNLVRSTEAQHFEFGELLRYGGDPVHCFLSLKVGGRPKEVEADVSVYGRTAVALVSAGQIER